MLKKIFYFIWPLILGIFVGISIIYIYSNKSKISSKFLSPLGINPEILASHIPSDKPLIGFLPYWNINTAQIPYHLLDWLAYFSVTLDYDGSLQKSIDNQLDMGWYLLGSDNAAEIFEQARKKGVKLMLTVTCFNNENIDTIIKNEKSKTAAIENIAQLVREYKFEGVNIDFEYNLDHEVIATTDQYVIFLEELKRELQTINQNIVITADVYANGIIKDEPYDSKKLSDQLDYLVLMGYDFHQANSPKAGPVAPIKSQSGANISKALDSALAKKIDNKKLILAMPFYGYEWQTVDENYGSNTYPKSGAMASYKRVNKLIEDEDLEVKWDFVAMSPWISYEKKGVMHQIYYENDDSVRLKLDLIDQMKLGGGAIWALGYEGENASVWEVIENWRKKD